MRVPETGLQMSAIAVLRSATRSAHGHLDQRLNIQSRFGSVSAYRDYLERTFGYYAAHEGKLGTTSFDGGLPDYDARRKVPLLTRDLAALGMGATGIRSLPVCPTIPTCGDAAAAFGSAYVLEGATLGGRTLLPLVERQLGLSATNGAAFLASYGVALTSMWTVFITALEECCVTAESRAGAAAAALATFESLEEWLCGASS